MRDDFVKIEGCTPPPLISLSGGNGLQPHPLKPPTCL